jgi:hypothetical protein
VDFKLDTRTEKGNFQDNGELFAFLSQGQILSQFSNFDDNGFSDDTEFKRCGNHSIFSFRYSFNIQLKTREFQLGIGGEVIIMKIIL